MKQQFLWLLAMLLVFTACTDSTTTTTTGTDSTATAVADSTKTPADSAATAEVVTPTTDSAATAADPGDQTGKLANPNDVPPITTTYRFTISFISIGAGIDHTAKTKYDQFVIDFGKRNKVKLAHEVVGWGREGEVDYCFKLAELKELQQAAFVKESKALVNGNELVQTKENANCRIKRK
jgi:hypothetical protein